MTRTRVPIAQHQRRVLPYRHRASREFAVDKIWHTPRHRPLLRLATQRQHRPSKERTVSGKGAKQPEGNRRNSREPRSDLQCSRSKKSSPVSRRCPEGEPQNRRRSTEGREGPPLPTRRSRIAASADRQLSPYESIPGESGKLPRPRTGAILPSERRRRRQPARVPPRLSPPRPQRRGTRRSRAPYPRGMDSGRTSVCSPRQNRTGSSPSLTGPS
mmetsp:Transcript_28749/g.84800  ORF Transcript_28749/g.84800 Transcript_28749/m.84800 type:complete len:215 (-) Transcript_28749:1477-2121(-)